MGTLWSSPEPEATAAISVPQVTPGQANGKPTLSAAPGDSPEEPAPPSLRPGPAAG